MGGRMRCAPICKYPEKRDFMDVNPPRSSEDFYVNYDPMVGIGTAVLLTLFILVVTIKSIIKWTVRKYRILRFNRHHAHDVDHEHEFTAATPAIS
ncbi:hypothetical protein AB6A40_001780 [Gnathostoma spinigerum]|uniref:Uncharacterized protein n=1 Tax=Gnathostoma spinigerum TaxID=75299 RepID=A0ABD6ECH7_9BILA